MSEKNITNTNTFYIIIKGLLISIAFTLVSLLIFSIILTYTNLSESTIPIAVIGITMVSILVGSAISMGKLSRNGLINGSILGIIYIMILYILSSILNTGFTVNIYTIVMILLGIVAGMIGGIIGVNR